MAKKLIHATPNGVKVYRDSEWEQFIVIPAGMKPSDDDAPFYFTDDKEDAFSTAERMGERMENPMKRKSPGHRAIYTVLKWNREKNTVYGNPMFSFTVEGPNATRFSGKTKPNYDFVHGLPMLYPGDKIDAILETTPSGRLYMTDADPVRGRNPVPPLKSKAVKRKTQAVTQRAAEGYVHRVSQITKRPPSKRLKTRRTKNLRVPVGYFPNPIKGVKTTPFFVAYTEHEGDRYYYGGSKKNGDPIFDSDIRKAFFAFENTPLGQHITAELAAHVRAKGLKMKITKVHIAGGEIIPDD